MNSSTPDFSTMNLGLRLGGWNVRTLVIRGHFNLIVFKHELFYPGLFNHESGVEIFGVEMSGNPQNGQRHQLLSSWFVVTRRNMRVTGSNAMSVVKNFARDITWLVIWQLIKTDIVPVDMTGLLIFYQCHGFRPISFRVICRCSLVISKGHMTDHQDSHCNPRYNPCAMTLAKGIFCHLSFPLFQNILVEKFWDPLTWLTKWSYDQVMKKSSNGKNVPIADGKDIYIFFFSNSQMAIFWFSLENFFIYTPKLLSSWFVVMRKNVRVTGSSAMFVVKIFGNVITWHVTWQPIKTEKKKWAWLMWMWTWAWTWAWILTKKFIIDYYARLKYYMYVVSSPVFLVTGASYEASFVSVVCNHGLWHTKAKSQILCGPN